MPTFNREAAKKAGYSDNEIDSYLNGRGAGERQSQIGSVNRVPAPEQNLVSQLLGILSPGIVNIGRDVLESRRVNSQVLPQAQAQQKQLEQASVLAKQAVLETDPAKKKALLDQSRMISGQTKTFETNFSPDIERSYLDRALQAGVEGGLMLTPFLGKLGVVGKAVQGLAGKSPILQTTVKTGLKGGVVGDGLLGATQEGDIPQRIENTVMGMALGGATGNALDLGSAALSRTQNFIKNLLTGRASSAYTKATPSVFKKVVVQHGKDINKIAQKYVSTNSSYDDMLGSVAERGNGGVIGNMLKEAEGVISNTVESAGRNFRIKPDDLLATLKQQRKIVARELGGGARTKAIDELIKQTKNKYKNGVSVKQAMETLRYANKKFGENVVKTKASDAMANAAQKVEANTLRSVLKKIFPDVAEALDTQSELLTLKSVLNHARSVSNTQGSKIRVGRSLLDILDYPLQQPKISSRLMQPQQPNVGGNMGGAGLLSSMGITPFMGGSKSDAGLVSPADKEETPQGQPNGGVSITPEQMQQVELSDISESTKAKVRKAYEIQQKQNKAPSAAAAKEIVKANAALSALKSVESELGGSGGKKKIILSMLPLAPGAQLYRSKWGSIIDAIGSFRTGAAYTPEQRKDYAYMLPKMGDSDEVIAEKIKTLKEELSGYANMMKNTSLDTLMLNQ